MLDKEDQLYMCGIGNIKVIVVARDRESAKRNAHSWIGGNPEQYTVTPLTNPGDRIHLALTLYV